MTTGKSDKGRDSGGFIALPYSVLDCPAYATLSHPARSLLLEVARQYSTNDHDNGQMLLSMNYLKKRGWLSADVVQRAKQDLLDKGFIFETVKGHWPKTASWYAVTWRALDKLPGYDPGTAECFERGAYRNSPAKEKRPAPTFNNQRKSAGLIPPDGTYEASIVPPHGTEGSFLVPANGTINADFQVFSVPSNGHPLDMPSTGLESAYGSYQ